MSLQVIASCRSFKDGHNRFVENTNLYTDVQIRQTFPLVKKFNGLFNKISICLLIVPN